MNTSTSTYTYTSTHVATYLTDAILGTLAEAIAHARACNPTVITNDWALTEAGIRQAWLEERSLKRVSVEFSKPSGSTFVVDFPVEYSSAGIEDASSPRRRHRILPVPEPSTAQMPAGTRPAWSSTTSATTTRCRDGVHSRLSTASSLRAIDRRNPLHPLPVPPPPRASTTEQISTHHVRTSAKRSTSSRSQPRNHQDRSRTLRRSRHIRIRDHVRTKWALTDDFLTGSYRRATKTKPLKDVDVFVVIDPDGPQGYLRHEPPGRGPHQSSSRSSTQTWSKAFLDGMAVVIPFGSGRTPSRPSRSCLRSSATAAAGSSPTPTAAAGSRRTRRPITRSPTAKNKECDGELRAVREDGEGRQPRTRRQGRAVLPARGHGPGHHPVPVRHLLR